MLRGSRTHHVPLDMTVECPEARVVRVEAQHGVRVRGNDECITTAEGVRLVSRPTGTNRRLTA